MEEVTFDLNLSEKDNLNIILIIVLRIIHTIWMVNICLTLYSRPSHICWNIKRQENLTFILNHSENYVKFPFTDVGRAEWKVK